MTDVAALAEVVAYLRAEPAFNRSWTDGSRPGVTSPEYIARRIELADERERWAVAVETTADSLRNGERICAELVKERDEAVARVARATRREAEVNALELECGRLRAVVEAACAYVDAARAPKPTRPHLYSEIARPVDAYRKATP